MSLFDFLKKDETAQLKERIRELETLCEEKDSLFRELMSDACRHGSSLGGKYMADWKKYLNGK